MSEGIPMPHPPVPMKQTYRRAAGFYLLASAILSVGIPCAAVRYPGSFDWMYTVISALASRKHNPEGAAYFAAALAALI